KAGFGSRWWQITPQAVGSDGSVAVSLDYSSADGEEGYPGRLDVQVRYTLTLRNEWRIDYPASPDRATVVNLTHHDYFNLAGGGSALDHRLTLAANRFACVDRHLIPQRLAEVAGTAFDFRVPRVIASRLRDADPQLVFARGYDHCWVL